MNATAPDLRLTVITDRAMCAPRDLDDVIAAALGAGAPAIQLRDKDASARALLQSALRLRRLTDRHGALLIINDRLDVALASGADGVHLGPDDIPIARARRVVPPDFLIGHSTDDVDEARRAARAGASYIGCGAVFATTSKAEAAGEAIGPNQLDRVARAVDIPVIGIGGISTANIAAVAATHAAGAAVISAVMRATDPGAVVKQMLRVLQR